VQGLTGAPPPKELRKEKAEWLKPGLMGEVETLKGEEKLRHASLKTRMERMRGTSPAPALASRPRSLIPDFDGASLSSESKEALWARFSMGAPRRRRRSVERYNIVMSGRRPLIKGLFSAMGRSRVRSCLRPVVAVL
jgi:hypothetical protein